MSGAREESGRAVYAGGNRGGGEDEDCGFEGVRREGL